MKVCDLTTGSTKLNLAMRTIREARELAKMFWDDQRSNEFYEEHIEPMEPKIKQGIEAVNRLTQVLAKAERECGDYMS